MNTRFLIFVGIVQGLLLIGHGLLYLSLTALLAIPEGGSRIGLLVALALLSISFVAASVLAYRFDAILLRVLYTGAAVWLGLLHLLILASIALWLVVPLLGAHGPTVAGLVYSAAIVAGAAGWYATRNPRITRVTVSLPNLAEPWRGKSLVWVSDIHLGKVNGRRFLQRIVNKINRLQPEVVCIGGDLFDGGTIDLDRVVAPLKDLRPELGTFFVAGNHELFGDTEQYLAALRKRGVRILEDEIVESNGLQVIGIDYRTSRNAERMAARLESLKVDPGRPSILFVHSPDRLELAEQAGVSLQVSGHTHRGQMWPFSLLTHRIYRGFDYGLKRFGAMQVFTSSGTGTWGPPVRFGTRSEIVAITLN